MELKTEKNSHWIIAGVILIIASAVIYTHLPALKARALCFDDNQYLIDNPLVKNPGWASAWRFLREVWKPTTVSGYYQPLTMISLMVDYSIADSTDNLTPFHTTSLIIHLANTLLIIFLLYLLFGNFWVAAAVGFLFGIHPMTVETITWIGERKTLLSAFFAFLSLIAYVVYQRKTSYSYYFLCMLAYVLAMMAKPISLTLPLLMLLLDFWPLNRLNKKAILEKIPFFILMAFFAIITIVSQKRSSGIIAPGSGHSALQIIYIICHNIAFYPLKILWPVNLSSHYAFPAPLNWSDPMIQIGVIGSVILLVLLLISLRFTRSCIISWLFFFIAILPTMQILKFSNVIASDKYAYLPAFGFLMLLTFALTKLFGKINLKPACISFLIAVLLFACVCVAEVYATRRYLSRWSDTQTLYQYMLVFTPDAPSLHFNLAYALDSENRLPEALEEYYKTIELDPNDGSAHQNAALILEQQGNFEQAVKEYQTAIKLMPNPANAYSNLAALFNRQGRTDEALNYLELALKANPNHGPAHFNLATILYTQGDFQNAIIHLQQCIKSSPDYSPAYFFLGVLQNQQGEPEQALQNFRQAAALEDKNPIYHKALAAVLLSRTPLQYNDIQQAFNSASKAAELTNYKDPEILSILANAYAAQGSLNKAVEICRLALELANQQNNPIADVIRQQLDQYQFSPQE